MSVIIRLQNLPWSANSLDIRHYFRGLSIPEGGVHIVGGEMGDAFIAFSTDEDARRAMMLGGGKIKEVQISLMLSSRSEMQKIIEAARQASMSNSFAQLLAPPVVPIPTIPQQPIVGKERRDSKGDKKDSSDLSSSSHETGSRRDRREKSRSRSRDRNRKDRRDRDRDRDRDRERDKRRRSRSRSRSRDRRRRRSRSRSRGRDSHNRDRERKEGKEDVRKDKDGTSGGGPVTAGTDIPNLDILNPNTWSIMQQGGLAQNAPLLSNFELLRSLANQKGPLIPGGPNSLLSNPINAEKMDCTPMGERFPGRGESPRKGDFSNRGNDFGNRNKGDGGRGGQRGFKNFEEGNSQDGNMFGEEEDFDRNRGPNMFQNFCSGFPMRNGDDSMNNSRFGNFARSDNGFSSRGSSRDRSHSSRGLLDLPVSLQQRDDRFPNSRQDRFSNRDDRVDEFGRSIQLRNRKNASNDDSFKDDNGKFQGNQSNFSGFSNRFGGNQPNQDSGHFSRGRDSWPPGGRGGDGFPDRRGFRGFDEPGRGFRGKGKFHDDSDHSGRPLEKDCCVEIRHLSPQVAYGEVRRPFSNLKLIIKEIKFLDYGPRDKKCRIRFLNNEIKRKALQMSNKFIIDNKQVQLLHINDSDFDDCIDEGVKRIDVKFSDDEDDIALSPKDVCIQVKDLSMNVEESDISKMFPNAPLEKVIIEVAGDGKSKSAYVKFQKPVDAKVALGTPNRSIGDCLVFLTPLPLYEFNDRLNKTKSEKSADSSPPEIVEVDVSKQESEPQGEEDKSKLTCVIMKNLPLEANDRDICDFFSDIGLVPNKIHLMLDMSGQPSGDAFCEFSDCHQTERACSKNSAPLGKNNVTVCQVPRSEMLEALGIVQGGQGAGGAGAGTSTSGNSNGGNTKPQESFGRPQCVVSLENIPFRAGVFDIINFFGWSYNLTENDVMRRYNDRRQPTGDARVCLKSPEDANRAMRFLNNRNLMGRVIRMKIL